MLRTTPAAHLAVKCNHVTGSPFVPIGPSDPVLPFQRMQHIINLRYPERHVVKSVTKKCNLSPSLASSQPLSVRRRQNNKSVVEFLPLVLLVQVDLRILGAPPVLEDLDLLENLSLPVCLMNECLWKKYRKVKLNKSLYMHAQVY